MTLQRWIPAPAAVLTLLALATPASALGITLTADPALSTIASASTTEFLSGTVQLEVGTLPVSGNTSFDVTAVSLVSSGGTNITLDPSVSNPGLGVLNDAGAFLVPNLFVRLDDGGGPVDLTVVDVMGSVTFGPGGASIESASTTFVVDAGALGDLTVSLLLVPEPSTLALATGGLAALAFAARARRRETIR